MLELLAAGALDKSEAFPAGDLSAELVARVHIKKGTFGYTIDDDYLELVEPLRAMGRPDLARCRRSGGKADQASRRAVLPQRSGRSTGNTCPALLARAKKLALPVREEAVGKRGRDCNMTTPGSRGDK